MTRKIEKNPVTLDQKVTAYFDTLIYAATTHDFRLVERMYWSLKHTYKNSREILPSVTVDTPLFSSRHPHAE